MSRKMKDSGVEWIGYIPDSWNTTRLGWCVNEVKEKNNPIKTTNVLSLTNKLGVVPYEEKGNQGNKAKEDYSQYGLAFENTLVVNSMNVLIGSVGISNYFGCVSPVYYVYRANDNSDLRYINYLFQNVGFQKEMRKYANGILEIRMRISSHDMLRRIIPIPSLVEQKKISDYLDDKCGEIDNIISKTQASIEEYKRLKQSIITQAVTKGVRGDREMIDSGNPLMGMISNNRRITKVKFVSNKVTDGAHVSPEYDDDGYEYISTVNVKGDKIDFDGCIKTSPKSYKTFVNTGCQPHLNDVLISKDGSVGKTVVIDFEREFVVGSSLVIISPITDIILPQYLNYNLKSDFVQEQLLMIMHGTALKRVSVEKNANLPVLLVDINEQKEIVDYLDDKCSQINTIIEKKEKSLFDLNKYKQALIYEYVTGKKEVI